MQKIEYMESPSPHVIVRNFMSTIAARECLAEAQWLEPTFQDARVTGMPSPDECDSCEECKAQNEILRSSIRHNKIVYLDEYYHKRRHESKLLSHLEQAIIQQGLLKTFATFPYMFPIIQQTTYMETILSSYGMCDFYGFHKDTLPGNMSSSRVLTCVVHFNTEPQQFEGGELILTGDTIQDQYAHQPSHNTAVFFQSNQCVHAVGETKHEGSFKDSRFSINLWLGFNPGEITSESDGMDYYPRKYR